ncbi:MAG TPA: universal stress protein [Chondromyces sp.]|jgi:nucleotide-binding universal stress UspA family protein|nr:universal stress protein [Chondromyces sp.]
MAYTRICVAAALQRYLDITPIAARIRDLAGVLAAAYRVPISVLSVEAPVELLPDVETMEEKIERYAEPLRVEDLKVDIALRKGRPSTAIIAHVQAIGADLLIIGSHSKRGPLDVGLGSTAAALLRDLETTVLMVRPTESEQEAARELMIPRYPIVFPYG